MISGIDKQLCRPPQTKAGERRSAPILQFNKVFANGRLQKWPSFAKALYLALGSDLRLFWPTEAITAP
jgi:hypothetical protein